MKADFISNRQLFTLLGVCLPLTALWGYALLHALREWARAVRRGFVADPSAPLDPGTWALLILLTGWFGAIAYLLVMQSPRVVSAWRRRLSPLQAS